ncbi:Leucine Rich Repeat family protein, related [Eimeria maxima]|uniref:Leucine Rich Repeat family protein, related n=1 Tax=Eimeria maxima TaxID=5804 RepID=U6M350_EIMMA|nr:Leucine Rich Repeat family protein, related [Eimeria maxima]CDJ58451.1 Leucine Rich Repeat family protein, related [Eimeria maxima]
MDMCCDNYHLVDLLLPALKEEAADPVILAASCIGVRVILENPRQRNELLQYVTEEMQGFEGLLQYLGGTRYTTMCDRAELALRNVNQLPYVPERVPLTRLTNIYACRVLASICSFLAYYLGEENDLVVQGVAERLFAAHREKAIVDVLEVKNEEVLVAAVECLNSMPLRYITKETVTLLIKLICRLPYPHAGLTSSVLQSVIKLLGRLAAWESPQVHAVLWGEHALESVAAVFDVIYKNLSTLRVPARKAVIENMHALNKVGVHFLLTASRVESTRDVMRLKQVVSLFAPVLEAEQQLPIHPDGFDVVVERTWGWPDLPDAGKELSLRDFVRLCVAERLSLLLAPLCNHSTTQRYSRQRALKQHAEYWAGRLKADIEDTEEEIARASLAEAEAAAEEEEEQYVLQQPQQRSELARAIKQQKPRSWKERLQNRNRPHGDHATGSNRMGHTWPSLGEVWKGRRKKPPDPLEALQDNPIYADLYGKSQEGPTGRERLMQELMATDLEPGAVHTPQRLLRSLLLWANFHASELQPCYIIAATLRLLYAAIEYPQIAEAREDTVNVCRRLVYLRSLTALVEAVPFLAANVGAKFCRLMQRVLRLEPHQPAESMDLILNYDIVAE